MLNRIQIPDHPDKSPFEIIYRAAQTQDKTAITALLDQSCIDVRNKSTLTPVAKLAEENNTDAVNFLIKHFGASLRWAIFGYARGLHFDPLNKILDEYAGNNTFLLCEVVYGLVYAKQQAVAKRILDNNPDKLAYLLGYYAYGLGHSGENWDHELLDVPSNYLAAFRINQCRGYGYGGDPSGAIIALNFWNDIDNKMVSELARAYATVDNTHALAMLFKKYPTHRLNMLPDIVSGYAQSGLFHRINTLFKQNEMVFSEAILHTYEGLLSGGHLRKAQALKQQVTEIDLSTTLSISHLALNGHFPAVKKILKMLPELWPKAIFGFMIHTDRQTIVKRLAKDPHQINLYTKIIIAALATHGDSAGVDDLIDDNTDQLEELLQTAAAQYALCGHHKELNDLLHKYHQHSVLFDTAALHYAIGHHYTQALVVDDEDESNNFSWQKATARGLMISKSFNAAFALCKINRKYAFQAIVVMAEELMPLCQNKHDGLIILATINHAWLRVGLAVNIQKIAQLEDFKLTSLLPEAGKLNAVMAREKIPLYLARQWLDTTLQVLLLQGPALVTKMKISCDVYFHILSFYTDLAVSDLKLLGYQWRKYLDNPASENNRVNKENIHLTHLLAKSGVKPCWQAKSPLILSPLADRSNVMRFR